MRHRSPTARPLALLGSIAALLLAPSVASANLITVNDPGDPFSTGCTLHGAIDNANAGTALHNCAAGTAGPDGIDFNLPPSTTISLAGPLPDITQGLSITGPGSGQLTITGNDLYRPVLIDPGVTVDISGLTITHGCGCPGAGGGIQNSGMLSLTDVLLTNSMAAATSAATNNFAEGGGIHNASGATLSLLRSTISGNTVLASGGTSQNGANGGGIMNRGTLLIDRSTVSGNHATAVAVSPATTNVRGGGIDTDGPVATGRSTISGNIASGTGGATNSTAGGGISAFNDPLDVTISLDRTTVSGNSVIGDVGNAQAGGVQGFGSNFTVTSSTISGNSALSAANLTLGATSKEFKNTIVSNPLGGGLNCASPTATSLGFNIEDGTSCGFAQSTDHPDTDPMIAALADNGGPTMTMALLTGSPAIDQGLLTPGETTDQRVLTRPIDFPAIPNAPGGDGTDIGAFEIQLPVVPPPTSPATTSPTTTAPAPVAKKKCKKGRKLKHGKCVKKKHKL
jgi:hypothetical protein